MTWVKLTRADDSNLYVNMERVDAIIGDGDEGLTSLIYMDNDDETAAGNIMVKETPEKIFDMYGIAIARAVGG